MVPPWGALSPPPVIAQGLPTGGSFSAGTQHLASGLSVTTTLCVGPAGSPIAFSPCLEAVEA